MSVTELKSELDRLPAEERRQLTAYLVAGDRMLNPEFRQELTREFDDKSGAVPIDEARMQSVLGRGKQLLEGKTSREWLDELRGPVEF